MIPIGTKFRLEQIVTEELTAAKIGSGLLPVFGTPFLCAMMENAAQSALTDFLAEGQGTVGIQLNVHHDAPTPVGMTVWAEAEVTAVSENGKIITFSVTAGDEKGAIGGGTHVRALIWNEKFLAKCRAKLDT